MGHQEVVGAEEWEKLQFRYIYTQKNTAVVLQGSLFLVKYFGFVWWCSIRKWSSGTLGFLFFLQFSLQLSSFTWFSQCALVFLIKSVECGACCVHCTVYKLHTCMLCHAKYITCFIGYFAIKLITWWWLRLWYGDMKYIYVYIICFANGTVKEKSTLWNKHDAIFAVNLLVCKNYKYKRNHIWNV